jgi:hypothetical protein
MNTEDLLQELSVLMYRDPLVKVQREPDYPRLANPLHLAILLLDCDTEIAMSGMSGFVSGANGRHLAQATEALRMIGSTEWVPIFEAIQGSMSRHGVSWAQFQGDPGCLAVPEKIDAFKKELGELGPDFSLFNTEPDTEDTYGALCHYVEERMAEFGKELHRRKR